MLIKSACVCVCECCAATNVTHIICGSSSLARGMRRDFDDKTSDKFSWTQFVRTEN